MIGDTVRTLITLAATLLGVPTTTPSHATHAAPRAVALADASGSPAMLRLVKPRRAYASVRQCARGTYFTDTQAYTWRGGKVGRQRWNRDHTVTYWNTRTGRVSFDGIVWRGRY